MKLYSEHCSQNIVNINKTQYKQADVSTILQVGLLSLCFGWLIPMANGVHYISFDGDLSNPYATPLLAMLNLTLTDHLECIYWSQNEFAESINNISLLIWVWNLDRQSRDYKCINAFEMNCMWRLLQVYYSLHNTAQNNPTNRILCRITILLFRHFC